MTKTNSEDEDRRRVGVIDDEPEIGDIIRRALRRQYEVDVYESAGEAFAALREGRRYQVLLCDVLMPEVSGREVADRLADEWPDQAARLVLMSGASGQGTVLDDFDGPILEKPFRLSALRKTVRQVSPERS